MTLFPGFPGCPNGFMFMWGASGGRYGGPIRRHGEGPGWYPTRGTKNGEADVTANRPATKRSTSIALNKPSNRERTRLETLKRYDHEHSSGYAKPAVSAKSIDRSIASVPISSPPSESETVFMRKTCAKGAASKSPTLPLKGNKRCQICHH